MFNIHLLGQSNMGKWYDINIPPRSYYPDIISPENCSIYIANKTETLSITSDSGPGVVHMATIVREQLGTNEQINIIGSAEGGSSTQDWIDTFLGEAIQDLSDFNIQNVDLIVWCQGEADISLQTSTVDYKNNLQTIFDTYYQALGFPPNDYSSVPRTIIVKTPVTLVEESNRTRIRNAQEDFANDRNYIDITGLQQVTGVDGGIHFLPGVYAEQAHLVCETYYRKSISSPNRPTLLGSNTDTTEDYTNNVESVFVVGGNLKNNIRGSNFDDVINSGGQLNSEEVSLVIGSDGNNKLNGGDGKTIFVPCNPLDKDPGVNTFSIINLASKQQSTVVLGDARSPYYLSNDDLSFCLVWVFDSDKDVLIIHGFKSKYYTTEREELIYNGSTILGTSLRWKETGELIGYFRGGKLDLESNNIKELISPIRNIISL